MKMASLNKVDLNFQEAAKSIGKSSAKDAKNIFKSLMQEGTKDAEGQMEEMAAMLLQMGQGLNPLMPAVADVSVQQETAVVNHPEVQMITLEEQPAVGEEVLMQQPETNEAPVIETAETPVLNAATPADGEAVQEQTFAEAVKVENAAQPTDQSTAEQLSENQVKAVEEASAEHKTDAKTEHGAEHQEQQVVQQGGSAETIRNSTEQVSAVKKEKPVTEQMTVSKPEEILEKLPEKMTAQLLKGIREFEIQIEPKHLGKIAIKVLYEAEGAMISIACSEKKTLELIGQNAREIGSVMERNLGSDTIIYVEKKDPDYQETYGEDHTGRNSEQDRQKEEQKKQKTEDGAQFLQKLRLGLIV